MNIPFTVLAIEIANSFNLSYKDAEEYAKWLVNSCLKEYSIAYGECTVARED